MFDVHRLPSALLAATFVLSGVVATSGVAAVAVGVGGDSGFCPSVSDDRPAGDILDCLGPSTAYIETALGSGSGLVLPGGYLLTNAHVVNPFDEVKVTIGEEEHTAVKVVGVDLFADIAVIGPVDTEAGPVHLVDPGHLAKGDELFLVGYPGEANTEDLEPTVADGILSRTRTSKAFGLHYLQTDASIGGGQSGGALVDRTGGVVGISSLRFAENFALALSGADAQAAVDKILAGEGSTYTTWPGGEQVSQAALELQGGYVAEMLNVATAPEDRTIEVQVPADLPVMVITSALEDEDPLQVMGNLRPIAAAELGVPVNRLPEVPVEALQDLVSDVELGELVRPGTFRFRVPAGRHVTLNVMTNREDGFSVAVATSLPVSKLSAPLPKDLTLGESVDATVGTLVPFDQYRVELRAGQAVHIEAGSPSGDMQVVVTAPNGEEKEFDDSRAGLYGVDVDEVYTAPAEGEYILQVGQVSDAPTGYHLVISGA